MKNKFALALLASVAVVAAMATDASAGGHGSPRTAHRRDIRRSSSTSPRFSLLSGLTVPTLRTMSISRMTTILRPS
jgi:hypothetical protein